MANDRPLPADRQKVRALALNAAATFLLASRPENDQSGTDVHEDALRFHTVRFMQFIETGRWPE